MFERPHLLWLLMLVPVAVAPGILAMRGGMRRALRLRPFARCAL